MPFTDEQIARIWDTKVQSFWTELLALYDPSKFPEATYEQGMEAFRQPGTLTEDLVENLLRWKYGRPDGRRLSSKVQPVVTAVRQQVAAYRTRMPANHRDAQAFWDDALGKRSFVTRCFLVHLAFPAIVPIVDRFNWRAFRYFNRILQTDAALPIHATSCSWNRAAQLLDFENAIVRYSQGSKTLRDVDRWLMMFGQRLLPKEARARERNS